MAARGYMGDWPGLDPAKDDNGLPAPSQYVLPGIEKVDQLRTEKTRWGQLLEQYSVCSLVVPTLEEAILTSVLKKNFKWPSILGQEGHSYSPKHSNLSYDQFGGGLEQSDTAPLLLPPGWRDTDSFSWICSVFNSSISRRSWNLFLCPCKWALRLKERWLNRWTWTTKRRTRPPTRWWTTCLQAR